jgi:CBS domain-containing protein
MPERIREVMTPDPISVMSDATLRDAAEIMRDREIGDVIVRKGNGAGLCGIITDRDIVVGAIAEGADPSTTTVDEVCSHELVTLGPDDAIAEAVELMSEKAVRRLPIVEGDQLVGVVSLGDLAEYRAPETALGEISSAPANN